MDSIESRVKIIESESERLKQSLDSLPSDSWTRNSACGLWEVRDVVAHLVWAAEFYLDTISRGINGDSSAPEGRPPGDALNAPSFDEYIAQNAIARRGELGDQLLQTFHARYDRLSEMMAGIEPQDWGKPCAFWRSRTIPADSFTFLTVQELAIHGWDILSAGEPAILVSPESVHVLLERIPQRPIPWLSNFETSGESSAPLRFRFDLTGASTARVDVVVEENRARMERAEDIPADVRIICDGGVFVLAMYGRLTLNAALAAGQLTFEGDGRLISDFDQWLKGAERPS